MLIMCSLMKLEDDEFIIDPMLEKVAYVQKRINGKVYTAWVKVLCCI